MLKTIETPRFRQWLAGLVSSNIARVRSEPTTRIRCGTLYDPALSADRTHACGNPGGHKGKHLCMDCGTEW